jgi:uncharacterized protein YozE (UPF0346 family)
MSSITFKKWLSLQRERNDPTGDFARDVKFDKHFPLYAKRLETYQRHIEGLGASDLVIGVLEDAWSEYECCAGYQVFSVSSA